MILMLGISNINYIPYPLLNIHMVSNYKLKTFIIIILYFNLNHTFV